MKTQQKPIILYVDDEPNNLTVFSATFFEFYQVLTAGSAKEAREILQRHPVQVLITDQKMPEISGVEFLESIIPHYPDIIRMVLTAYSDVEYVIAAINEGRVYRYIMKPWDEQELKMTLDGAIEYYQLQQKNKELVAELQEANRTLEQKVQERTRELAESNEQLIELNNEKNEFLGIAAHDLKNPLSNIKMLSKVLFDEYKTIPHEELKDYAGHILKASEQMFMLITNLLDVNAIERGGIAISPKYFDLSSATHAVVENYRARAEQKNIQLHWESPAIPVSAFADQNATVQVLDNLVSNAVKYSPPDKAIAVRLMQRGNVCRIEVQDQGPGLSAEDQQKLFGKFARLSAQPTAGEHSTGLGLSIVKKMVDMMSGKVWCESTLGHGATFILELPVQQSS